MVRMTDEMENELRLIRKALETMLTPDQVELYRASVNRDAVLKKYYDSEDAKDRNHWYSKSLKDE